MNEAGDTPTRSQGLEEIARPFARNDDDASDPSRLADPVESLEEDTVFLAPRRDFTPGGTPGGDDDIESPFAKSEDFARSEDFAKSEDEADAELMSPLRRRDEEPGRDNEPDGPARLVDVETSDLVHTAPPRMWSLKEDVAPSIPKAPPEALSPVAPIPPKPPSATSPVMSPPITPSLIRPRPVGPTLMQPTPAAPELTELRPRLPLADGDKPDSAIDRPPPDCVLPKLTPSRQALAPPSRGEEPLPRGGEPSPHGGEPLPDGKTFPRRRPVLGFLEKVDQETKPDRGADVPPPNPQRLVTGALTHVAGAITSGARSVRRGGRVLLAGLGVAWAAYSRGCLKIEIRLAQLAWRALSHGRWLAALTGTTLVGLGRAGVRGVRSGTALVWTAANAARPRAQAIGKNAISTSVKAVGAATAAARKLAAIRSARKESDASNGQAPAAPAVSRAAEPSPDVSRPALATKAAGAPDLKKTMEKAAAAGSLAGSLVGRGWAWLLSAASPPRPAFAGLAAASIGFLALAFGLGPAGAPPGQALTLSIPARPAPESVPQAPAEPSAALSEAEAAASEGDAVPSKLDDPLTEMIAYIGTLPKVDAGDDNPALTEVETIEGLDQFTRAADLVGLEQLLQPGETYTIFAPNDAAFAELAPGEIDSLLDPSGRERLLTLLSHHILPERLTLGDIGGDVRAYRTLAGQTMTIDATDVIRIGDAGMVQADIQAENGILHIIDQVLPVAEP